VNAIAALVPEIAGKGGDFKIEILRRIGEYEETNIQDASNVTFGASTYNFNDPSRWGRVDQYLFMVQLHCIEQWGDNSDDNRWKLQLRVGVVYRLNKIKGPKG
jgi:hypothetical protein